MSKKIFSLVLALCAVFMLCGCQKSIAGTYQYKGYNGLIGAEEIWTLEVAKDNTYTLSLTNDFLNAKNYGNVIANEDGTYTLVHTGSADEAYPYPSIVYGFSAKDAAGTDWECTGNFDFENMTFTPIVNN